MPYLQWDMPKRSGFFIRTNNINERKDKFSGVLREIIAWHGFDSRPTWAQIIIEMNVQFETAAKNHVADLLKALKALTYQEAAEMPRARFDDIVIAGKEVQLTLFKQDDIPSVPGGILVTAQIVRAGLGGVHSFYYEKGIVFEKNKAPREASEDELQATA